MVVKRCGINYLGGRATGQYEVLTKNKVRISETKRTGDEAIGTEQAV